jgi:hypothetical protein
MRSRKINSLAFPDITGFVEQLLGIRGKNFLSFKFQLT